MGPSYSDTLNMLRSADEWGNVKAELRAVADSWEFGTGSYCSGKPQVIWYAKCDWEAGLMHGLMWGTNGVRTVFAEANDDEYYTSKVTAILR